jgi:hypothetical protein
MKNHRFCTVLLSIAIVALTLAISQSTEAARKGRPFSEVVIYVTSQGLYYDSIVTADPLPWKGPFQKLEATPARLETDYGPGDPEYVGGRWWMDVNSNGEMDEYDHYFLCPLLPPGRETP